MGLDADFLELLTVTVVLNRFTGEDSFGNQIYAVVENIQCVIDPSFQSYGQDSSQDQQYANPFYRSSIITDALGLKVRDKIAFQGITYYLITAETTTDEFGVPLFQKSDLESVERG